MVSLNLLVRGLCRALLLCRLVALHLLDALGSLLLAKSCCRLAIATERRAMVSLDLLLCVLRLIYGHNELSVGEWCRAAVGC